MFNEPEYKILNTLETGLPRILATGIIKRQGHSPLKIRVVQTHINSAKLESQTKDAMDKESWYTYADQDGITESVLLEFINQHYPVESE